MRSKAEIIAAVFEKARRWESEHGTKEERSSPRQSPEAEQAADTTAPDRLLMFCLISNQRCNSRDFRCSIARSNGNLNQIDRWVTGG
jgi:hypothetical protein